MFFGIPASELAMLAALIVERSDDGRGLVFIAQKRHEHAS